MPMTTVSRLFRKIFGRCTYKVTKCCNIMIKWFQTNCLQANGSKFQTIVFSRMKEDNVPIMINKNIILEPQSCVKLLGV